jgi:RNA polymerase sigma factor (sigma-70 family)
VEKKNDHNFKKAQKAEGNRYTHEDELFSVGIGTYRFTAYIEKIVRYAKIDYLRHQQQLNEYEEPTDDMSKIVEQRSLVSLDDGFFVEALKAATLEHIASEERLYRSISKLSLSEKEVLYQLYVEERTPKEIAALMGNSWSWILRIKKHALNKLYHALDDKEEL